MALILSNERDNMIQLCQSASVEKVKEYYLVHLYVLKDQLTFDNNYIFRTTCQNGNLEVAQWLYDLNKIDMNDFNDAFFYSCYFNQLHIAKWLYSLSSKDKFKLSSYREVSLLHRLYRLQYFNIIKWLLSIDYFPTKIITGIHHSLFIKDSEPPKSFFKFLFQSKVIKENLSIFLTNYESPNPNFLEEKYRDYTKDRPKYYWTILKSTVSLLYYYNLVLRKRYSPQNTGYFEAKKSFESSLNHS